MTAREWEDVMRGRQWGRWADTRFVEWFMRTFGAASARERENIRVLELGCGAGAQLRFLQGEGFRAYGVDGSRAALQQAKRNLAMSYGFGPNVELIEADLQHFEPPQVWGMPETSVVDYAAPVSDRVVQRPDVGFFDCVVDVCTLQHLPAGQNAQVIQRARRWLRPGGWIFSKYRAADVFGFGDQHDRLSPHHMTRHEIPHIFPILELDEERLEIVRTGDKGVAHWIITGRKV